MTPEILRRLDTLEVRRVKQLRMLPAQASTLERLQVMFAYIAEHGEEAATERWWQVPRILEIFRNVQERFDAK